MYDLEAAADRMREACYQGEGPNEGPKKYTFFLLDKQAGGWGLFYWYSTKKALLKALERDLVGYLFDENGDEETEIDAFLERISNILSDSSETLQLSEGMRKKLDKLMTYSWHIPYIGSYENLLTSTSEWERELRGRFRTEHLDWYEEEIGEEKEQAPIRKDEREAFDEFVTQPFE